MFSLFLMLILKSALASPQPFQVVIDPGHGGHDEGAIFKNSWQRVSEKEITLKISQQVSQILESQGLRVTLTRDRDQEVSLPARTALANRLGADIFISIHMNSTTANHERNAEGVETYILNNTTDASSKRLAQLENSVILNHPPDTPEQMDVALILKDLRLDANLGESKKLACQIQENLVSKRYQSTASRVNRGVKQALFHVLLGADMPSVLVETGFINSLQDRKFILSYLGQKAISQAIADAVLQYRRAKKHNQYSFNLGKCKVN